MHTFASPESAKTSPDHCQALEDVSNFVLNSRQNTCCKINGCAILSGAGCAGEGRPLLQPLKLLNEVCAFLGELVFGGYLYQNHSFQKNQGPSQRQ